MRESRDLIADLPGRDIRMRLHVPEGAPAIGPVLFYFHGGGWALCSIDSHDRIMRELAARAGCRVVGVDYRKAPEHAFPLPFDDCRQAAAWMLASAASFGIDPLHVAFGGDSAGANLALAVGLEAAERGAVPASLLLFYGAFDCDLETASYRADIGDGRFGLSRADMEIFFRWYLPPDGHNADPRAAPIKGRVDLLRQVFVLACGLDPLRDDSRQLAAALAREGVSHVYREFVAANHGFLALCGDVGLARGALAAAAEHLRDVFRP
jgi:acetyl esterase